MNNINNNKALFKAVYDKKKNDNKKERMGNN